MLNLCTLGLLVVDWQIIFCISSPGNYHYPVSRLTTSKLVSVTFFSRRGRRVLRESVRGAFFWENPKRIFDLRSFGSCWEEILDNIYRTQVIFCGVRVMFVIGSIIYRAIIKSNGNLSFRFSFSEICQVVQKILKTLSRSLLKGK